MTVGGRQWQPARRPGPPPPAPPQRREGGVLTPLMLIAGGVLTALALLAGWAQWQLLDSEAFGDTSEELVQRNEVRDRAAEYIVDEVRTASGGSLPPEFGSNPERSVAEVLETRRAQRTWRAATTETHRELVRLVDDQNATSGDRVTLDLRRLIGAVSQELGVPLTVPPDAGRITIVAGDEVTVARDTARQLKRLALFLFLAAPAMFALAVAVARGWRMRALSGVGIAIAVAGAIVFLARTIAGSQIVNALASSSANRDAGQAVWSVLTSLLGLMAIAAVLGGLGLALAAGVAARSREPRYR